MTLPDGYTYATATEQDKREIYDLDLWAFPSAFSVDKFMEATSPLDPDRTVLVRDDSGELAAMHSSYAFGEFEVPGATLPTAGLTWVGVHPQHRRRGILRAMIQRHFAQCVERGEAISTLFAAEPSIYGRFGYGESSFDLRATFSRGAAMRTTFGESVDSGELTVRIERFDREKHEELVEALHMAAGRNALGTGLNRPGWAKRETQALRDMTHEKVDLSGGREDLRIVIVERAGQPVGYSRFRRKTQWTDTGSSGSVNAGEVIALDPAAAKKLWSVLLDFDLTTETTAFLVPVDDPIVGMLVDNRAIKMVHVDNVWTRIIRLSEALKKRQYAADIDVIIEVTDEMLPGNQGTWRVSAPAFGGPSGDEDAMVEPSNEPAQLKLDIRELGAIYLGGVTLASLAAAGLVEVRDPRALALTSAAFGWPVAPMSSWVF